MNAMSPTREAGSRSPPTTNLATENGGSQPGTPQRPAEVIQNRNAADGELESEKALVEILKVFL
jgi:hypothetical protein